MLFAKMFSWIPKRKPASKSQRPKNERRKLKKKLPKPISTLINFLRRKKNKAGSQPVPSANEVPYCASSLSSNSNNGCGSIRSPCSSGVQSKDFQHTLIYVAPVNTTDAVKVEVSRKVKVAKTPARITRALALRRECTSLPSIEPYRHPLRSSLRRSPYISVQRSSSAQPQVKCTDVYCKSPLLELPPSKSEESISSSSASFTSVSQCSSTSSLNEISQQSFTVTMRPPSRHGIAYEIVFKAPSVHCNLTPEPWFGPSDSTHLFTKANEEEADVWDTDGDTDDFEEEEEEEEEKEEIDAAPQCKYGVFFTAAKPPLPPSALERIRKYRNYQL